MQTFPLGEGIVLTVVGASDGWELIVGGHESPVLGRVPLPRSKVHQLLRRGATLRNGPIEIRGLRWEVEVRLTDRIVGRIRKADLEAALDFVEEA